MIIESNFHKKFFRIAKNISYKSDVKPAMGCVAVKGNRIVSRGYNKIGLVSTGSIKYANYPHSVHAERDCLRKLKKENLSNVSLYIYREFRGTKKPAMAKPCKVCEKMLKDLGITKVVYTIDEAPFFEVIYYK